jgi:Holliday junction resolvase-like predicted endonuclease
MGKMARNKGRLGERRAKDLLTSRDFVILADTTSGLATEDLVVQDEMGTIWKVEVKNTKLIDIPKFRTQAKTQAGKFRWLLLAKIDGTSSWLVMGKDKPAVVWHEKGE